MSGKATYHTRQSNELRNYLESVKGRHITAGDVCDYFRSAGRPMGAATVYRQLEKLVEDGTAVKYIIDPGSPACYEYAGNHPTPDCCYHCKCKVCGKLIHLRCEELTELSRHLEDHHGFALDPMRTVLFGVCRECLEGNKCE